MFTSSSFRMCLRRQTCKRTGTVPGWARMDPDWSRPSGGSNFHVTGHIMVRYWRYPGQILEISWSDIGDILVRYWRYPGQILEIIMVFVSGTWTSQWPRRAPPTSTTTASLGQSSLRNPRSARSSSRLSSGNLAHFFISCSSVFHNSRWIWRGL